MTGCYLTDLPRQFMRGVADFEPDYASSYFVPRWTIVPPLSLRQRVWPQLDRWRQAHLNLPGAIEVVHYGGSRGAMAIAQIEDAAGTSRMWRYPCRSAS
jgi:hypothetical protein